MNGRILKLVKSGPERRALDSGEIDAVLDPATRTAHLLPDAQRALMLGGAQPPNRLLAALPRLTWSTAKCSTSPASACAMSTFQALRTSHCWWYSTRTAPSRSASSAAKA